MPPIAAVAGQLVITATGANPSADQGVTTVVGTWYKCVATLIADAMTGKQLHHTLAPLLAQPTFGVRNIARLREPTNSSSRQSARRAHISVGGDASATAAQTSTWDNISLKVAVVTDVTAGIVAGTYTRNAMGARRTEMRN